jgi:histidinol-phosphatase (PHP family)
MEVSQKNTTPWMASLHGGHSTEFCDHGSGTLREILEAAVDRGFSIFGVAEHAPRFEERHVFAEERAMGWGLDRLHANFEAYARKSEALAQEFADRLMVMRGFEAEVVPSDRYATLMQELRDQYGFDYIVGSVHWVDETPIDYSQEEFDRAIDHFGGLEPLAVRYYEIAEEMARTLKPDVIGHLDVIRKYAPRDARLDTPAICTAARKALEAVHGAGAILDLNASALRKGLDTPYPAPWLLTLATQEFGIPVCFGDDSHGPKDVGVGLPEAREYLLRNGVHSITTLVKGLNGVERRDIPLE